MICRLFEDFDVSTPILLVCGLRLGAIRFLGAPIDEVVH